MQTGTGISLKTHVPRRRSTPWAILLFIGYWIMFAAEMSLIRFQQGADGRWIPSIADQPAVWLSLVVLLTCAVSCVVTVRYLVGLYQERRERSWLWKDDAPSANDVVHVVAWMHIYQAVSLFVYGLLRETPFFLEGTAGGAFESASFQLFLLVVIPLWFRGRGEAIGLRRPVRLWRMILVLLVLLVLIAQFLDVLVTKPVADWFGLSLTSEREQKIENELIQAKGNNLLAIAASILVIGLLVPFAEELLFRGVVQTYLVKRLGVIAGILLSSLWFALLHMDVAFFAPLLVIGIGLGWIRHHFQSIWGAVVLHAVNNLSGVLYYFQ
ncbi:CPBP family intramembrane glutamic endopeptidase [Brevibacillus sp. TJ4]|uniref:CPBP family intramembrane glutamic endopeptidase n=1 Tax=Brevibacillus sp. TJ4 TaxID=3234853 RepID=UPI0037D69D4B